MTVWPSHEAFDAWIATPERDALTDSDLHRSVDYRPHHPLRPRRRLHQPGRLADLADLADRHPTIQGDRTMKWVTRARPKTDRIACPWLIRRFIDPDAEILYVPAEAVLAVAEAEGAYSFDAPGARYHHRDGGCTFETLIADYDLGGDLALVRLSRIVHAADIDADLGTDPAGPGLLAIGLGGLDVEADDHRLLERASFVYDALYAWSATHLDPTPA